MAHRSSFSKTSSYRGETVAVTTVRLNDILKKYICNLSAKCALKPDLVVQMWAHVVGPQIAQMTRATRFENGVLFVSVKNSTLLSILSSQNDKKRLMHEIISRIPSVGLKDILFRFG